MHITSLLLSCFPNGVTLSLFLDAWTCCLPFTFNTPLPPLHSGCRGPPQLPPLHCLPPFPHSIPCAPAKPALLSSLFPSTSSVIVYTCHPGLPHQHAFPSPAIPTALCSPFRHPPLRPAVFRLTHFHQSLTAAMTRSSARMEWRSSSMRSVYISTLPCRDTTCCGSTCVSLGGSGIDHPLKPVCCAGCVVLAVELPVTCVVAKQELRTAGPGICPTPVRRRAGPALQHCNIIHLGPPNPHEKHLGCRTLVETLSHPVQSCLLCVVDGHEVLAAASLQLNTRQSHLGKVQRLRPGTQAGGRAGCSGGKGPEGLEAGCTGRVNCRPGRGTAPECRVHRSRVAGRVWVGTGDSRPGGRVRTQGDWESMGEVQRQRTGRKGRGCAWGQGTVGRRAGCTGRATRPCRQVSVCRLAPRRPCQCAPPATPP